jgi:hypothetical protein
MPSFTDYYLLQLGWNDSEFFWHRSVWKRDSDQKFLSFWMDFALEENKILPLELTWLFHEGKGNIIQIHDLLHKIESLRLKPYLNSKNESMGRDGDEIRLEFINQITKLQLEWITSSTPKEWEELDTLANLFYTLNSTLS